MAGHVQAREQILQLCAGNAYARTLRMEVLAVLRRVSWRSLVWRELLCGKQAWTVTRRSPGSTLVAVTG